MTAVLLMVSTSKKEMTRERRTNQVDKLAVVQLQPYSAPETIR